MSFRALPRGGARPSALWEANKATTTQLHLLEQIDYQSKLRKQFPLASQRVVYTKSGQHLAACRIQDPQAVIDHKLYWAAVDSVDEGRYLCAVLNSQVLADAVVGLQARGQHNPRDFDTNVFTLSFPAFDSSVEVHARLAALAARAEDMATEIDLDGSAQFQRARRLTREALRRDGVAGEIDVAVEELISDASVPDLMAIYSEAGDGTRARARQRASKPSTAHTGLSS